MSLPNAITREDFYLNKIANPSDEHELPDAITRTQHYLKAIAENAGGGGGGGGVNYSTEEQEVGTWIDGRPLYQITKKFENVSISANSDVTLESAWGMELVHAFGFLIESENRYAIPETSIRIEVDGNSGNLICVSKTSSWSCDLYITLQYTKPISDSGT